ncbi:polyketide synthase dehydratase [Hirsutella rhossiliensis]|uniref:Polyketide synthase dehydratase domain-containing protein n=1 Tax=Hirsutella rhossiliensis TaxID=111463 RepID=A0A9P8MV41_9HYPO|nr:polyketide synthase dehydratase domain-containing protein [Hirsutella rhossiliensis]KAH0962738.1 polyketide synthase dehydratase domain-containing protein [Hirsutella rhossiliensis]
MEELDQHSDHTVEALQMTAKRVGTIQNLQLRDVRIRRALVLADPEAGVESWFHLKPRKTGIRGGVGAWLEFTFYINLDGDKFVEHASGLCQVVYEHETPPSDVDDPAYQSRITTRAAVQRALIDVPDTKVLTQNPFKTGYLIHPGTLDSCFQAMFASARGFDAGSGSA